MGSTYSLSGNLSLMEKMSSFAQADVRKNRVSQIFKRNVLAAVMLGKGGLSGELGRPGAFVAFGGKPGSFSDASQSKIAAYERKIRVHAKTSSGFKHMGFDDTSPAVDVAQSQNNTSASYRYCHARQALKILNDDIRFAKGQYQIADPIQDATEEAVQKLVDNVTPFFYLGVPGDQTADKWSQPLGIKALCDTDNTFAGLNRGSAPYSTCWVGKEVTTAKSCSLSLIDDANITQGIQDTGPGVDVVICGKANYLKLKYEAQARGQFQTLSLMPKHLEVGARYEGFQYGSVTILYDNWIQDYSTGTWPSGLAATDISNYVFMLTSGDLHMDIHPEGNFSVGQFKDQGQLSPGGEDAITANIDILYRPWYEYPNRHIVYTSVS
jgi:hypothetical protein